MQKFKYILDNLIGRCPSCYYNFLRILCEMACSPDQDQFLWPLETTHIARPTEQPAGEPDENVRKDWALEDYDEPEEGDEDPQEKPKAPAKAVETVNVISKLRYFISEKQAQDFTDSCW